MKAKIGKEKFIKIIEKKLELPSNSLLKIKNLETNENWDSLSKMTFISVMQKQFKIDVNPDKLLKCKTTEDLYKLLK